MRKYYEPESFEKDYSSFLEDRLSDGSKRKGSYIDPDFVGDVGKMDYYIDMTDFLNSREEELRKKREKKLEEVLTGKQKEELKKELKNEYFFLPPLEAPGTEDWLNENREWFENHEEWWKNHKILFKKDKKWSEKYKAWWEEHKNKKEVPDEIGLMDKSKITVVQDGKKIFCLTSDQFGFSAYEGIYYKKEYEKYPLAKLLFLYKKKRKDKQEEIITRITKYVKNTRTIGGSFLWPTYLKETNKRKYEHYCDYNLRRGVNNYLEDRVDLTLLEVKHAFEKKYDHGECKSDILCSQYENIHTHMKKWLAHFDSFEEYVEYFMLEHFCEKIMRKAGKDEKAYDYIPINIIDGKPIDEDNIEKYSQSGRKNYHVRNLEKEDILNMLKRLEDMIRERSDNMKKAIRLYKLCRQKKGPRDSTHKA